MSGGRFGKEGSTPMRVQTRVLAPVTAMALLAATGCAGLSGAATSAASGQLEKTTLNVAVVPAVDSAGFFVALHEGLFAAKGLTINYTPATSSQLVINGQMSGKYDITGGNYVSYVQHVVQDHQPLEIIAEGSVMQQGTQAIYTLPSSKSKTLVQLKGYVLGASVLTGNGISLAAVDFPKQPIPFPVMAAKLAAGQVAAAALPEPFATYAE